MPGPNDHDTHGEDFDTDVYGDRVGYSSHGDHHTAFDRDSQTHISWDTDEDGDYVGGSGHTGNDQDHTASPWDS